MTIYIVLRNLFHHCSVCEKVFTDLAQAVTYCTSIAKAEELRKEPGKFMWYGSVDGLNIEKVTVS